MPFLTTQAELFSSGLGVNTTDVGRRVDAEGRRTQRKEGVSDLWHPTTRPQQPSQADAGTWLLVLLLLLVVYRWETAKQASVADTNANRRPIHHDLPHPNSPIFDAVVLRILARSETVDSWLGRGQSEESFDTTGDTYRLSVFIENERCSKVSHF